MGANNFAMPVFTLQSVVASKCWRLNFKFTVGRVCVELVEWSPYWMVPSLGEQRVREPFPLVYTQRQTQTDCELTEIFCFSKISLGVCVGVCFSFCFCFHVLTWLLPTTKEPLVNPFWGSEGWNTSAGSGTDKMASDDCYKPQLWGNFWDRKLHMFYKKKSVI